MKNSEFISLQKNLKILIPTLTIDSRRNFVFFVRDLKEFVIIMFFFFLFSWKCCYSLMNRIVKCKAGDDDFISVEGTITFVNLANKVWNWNNLTPDAIHNHLSIYSNTLHLVLTFAKQVYHGKNVLNLTFLASYLTFFFVR